MIEEQYKKLQKIHKAIRTAIELEGFAYRPAENWFNLELGLIPSGNLNHAFSIRFEQLADAEDSEDMGVVSVVAEFALDGKQDRYLDKIDLCVKSVKEAIDAIRADTDIDGINFHAPRFSTTYAAELIVITFLPLEVNYLFE
ncbi:MAG: hypothetical protein PHV11_06315 [Candidatus Bipolaricaulis sp.]|nr:hypothetical protein [Candidatus Bipolaricaulis sp.]